MLRPWKIQIDLDVENKKIPIYQQLANKVQQLIETGTLKAGEVLPGSRELAAQLHMSRKTVISAMELLTFGGWLENKERVGLFVRDRNGEDSHKTWDGRSRAKIELHVPGKEIVAEKKEQTIRLTIDDGYPDTKLVPYEELSRAFRQSFNRAARWKQMGYGDPRGDIGLRELLAQQLRQEHNMNAHAEEIHVTRGSQQALFLVAHALLEPGDAVVMESPSYKNARRAFESAGLEVIDVPVDDEGIRTDLLEQALVEHKNIGALYLTPRFQYPTTVTLSASRRRKIAELVYRNQLLVIEDDFGCQFHFTTQRLLPLCALLTPERAVYIGTFSKVLAPALRMGFIATAKANVDRVAEYRHLVDIQGDAMMERAIKELMENGDVRRHVKKAMKVYRDRLDYLCHRISAVLGDKVRFSKPRGGLALWLVLPSDPTEAFREKGIQASPFALPSGEFGFRIGYATLQNEEIDLVVEALRDLIYKNIRFGSSESDIDRFGLT